MSMRLYRYLLVIADGEIHAQNRVANSPAGPLLRRQKRTEIPPPQGSTK